MIYVSSSGLVEIDERVEAAECIANNNKSFDGKKLYDIESHFFQWKSWVKERMIKLYGDKANL